MTDTPKRPSLQSQIDALAARIEAGDAMRNDTHNKVSDLHRALMQPQYGQGEKSLIERMAAVTVEIESGKMVGKRIVFLAQICAAIGVIAASLYAAFNLGAPK